MATLPPSSSTDYALGFYARQPVFDAKNALWAYSIYFRDEDQRALAPDAQKAEATSNVLAAILGEGTGKPRIIKFAAQSLIYELPLLFPKDAFIVEVNEDLHADVQAMEALRKLKTKGYSIAVAHFSAKPAAALLYSLANILWVDALTNQGPDLERLARACAAFPAKAGLMRIEDKKVFELGKGLGFCLFQGNYIQQPETLSTRKLSSSQFSRLKLLQAIEQTDPDMKALAQTIRSDVALSFKLFGLLNSAFFSLPCEVQSVNQAITLLGWEPLRSWIRLVILTDLTPQGKSSELPRAATVRGRFLELAAKTSVSPRTPAPESLFLVGLFSLLPSMLDLPMSTILEALRLPKEVMAGLRGLEHPSTRWLELAVAFERANWPKVQQYIGALGLTPMHVAQSYSHALAWTDTLYRSVPA